MPLNLILRSRPRPPQTRDHSHDRMASCPFLRHPHSSFSPKALEKPSAADETTQPEAS